MSTLVAGHTKPFNLQWFRVIVVMTLWGALYATLRTVSWPDNLTTLNRPQDLSLRVLF